MPAWQGFQSFYPLLIAPLLGRLTASNFRVGETLEQVLQRQGGYRVRMPLIGCLIVGKPLFGTLIALLDEGQPVLGIIDQPVLKERWVGVKGRQSTFNGNP